MSKDRFKANLMRDRLSRDHRYDMPSCLRRDKAIAKDAAIPTPRVARQSVDDFLAAGGKVTKVPAKVGCFDPGFNQAKADRRGTRKARGLAHAGGVHHRGDSFTGKEN